MSIRTPLEQSVHDPVDIANPKLDSLSKDVRDPDALSLQVKCGECPHVRECPHARTLCPSTTTSLEVDTDSRTDEQVEIRALPYGLKAVIFCRDERADLEPETRARLDHFTESEAEYQRRAEREGTR